MHIAKAQPEHFAYLKTIADHNKHELGFTPLPVLQDAATRQELLMVVEEDIPVGYCNYHTREDKWTTVREIVIDQQHRGRGYGTELLNCIPRPFRLRCPVDLPSNAFYRGYGLTHTWQEEKDKGRSLNVWQTQPDIIFCAGNNKELGQIARDAGLYYGTRHDCVSYWKPYMVDINFKRFWHIDNDGNYLKEPNWKLWKKYLDKVTEWQPLLAMVPDYMSPGYRRILLRMAYLLAGAGIQRVMMCPKFAGAVAHIPDWCVVAVSVPSKYAGYLPDVEELQGRRVHLLGGVPKKQKELYDLYRANGINVISLDANTFIQAADFGTYFDGEKWKNEGYHAVARNEAFKRSCENFVEYWKRAGR